MSTTALGYVPYLRPGALLFTLAAFRHFQIGRGSLDATLVDLYGTTGGRKRNLFGESVATISKRAFGCSVPPRDVLLRHTFFGVYSRALSPAAAAAWSDALIAGDRSHKVQKVLRNFDSNAQFQLITRNLRSCHQCVADDISTCGFGQWRILHQIPALLFCPEHGLPLNDEIYGGSAGSVWQSALPQGRISTPADRTPWAASDGHSTYLDLWTQLLEGKLPVVTSHAWAAYMDLVVSKVGNIASAQTEIETTIRRAWSTDIANIRSGIGRHIMERFIHAELSHNSAPVRLAQKLIVLGAVSALGIDLPTTEESSQLRLDLCSPFNEHSAPPLQEQLRRFLLDAALPGALAPFLLTDRNTTQIARDASVHRRQVWKTMQRIPNRLLDEIASARKWPATSWVTIELKRRRETSRGP
ncbi:TniQ family protein [Lysobacter solisilvae (ex Woo and Kim 2020)]|uniref:TniQ family protein n=1 Tax=Agrilutibacter terrestris TaxID=2865112 RepID=A0A7H0FZZ2_9GAMM|nr:TniQ family protein [Lysobacter terrestris]QNP41608.1 TniQ family protein [Lysobacter terrestris]